MRKAEAGIEYGSERQCNKETAGSSADFPPQGEAQHNSQWLPRVCQWDYMGCSFFRQIVRCGDTIPQHARPM